MSAAYFGAGTDIRPVKFCNIKTFHYVDSQPYSEFGILQAKDWKNGYWTGGFTDGFSRPHFIPQLDKHMEQIDMKLTNVSGDVRTYTDGNKTVIYHTNVAIPEHCNKIRKSIENCDTIIVAGHDPHSKVLECFKKKLNFIGCETTVFTPYDPEFMEEEKYALTTQLHENTINNKFKSFFYLSNEGKIKKFNTWKKFVKYSCKND